MADIFAGAQSVFGPLPLLYIALGVLVGIIFGAIPGLTGTIGISLFLPLSYTMSPSSALLFLTAIFCGGEFGGSISAILIGTPGTNAAAATMMDGYPLAKQGKARKALLMALAASTFGGIFSACVLLFGAPAIAEFTVNFGPAEFFTLAVFGLSIISSVSGDNIWKGMISGCIGVLISLVGIDSMTGTYRLTFGNINMVRGLSLIPVLMGLFAVPSILEKIADCYRKKMEEKVVVEMDYKDGLSMKEIRGVTKTMVRSSVVGTIVGAIPGTGTGLASFLSYDLARKGSKRKENFGKGELEGIAASESANNAVTAGALIPLFTLGIPGSPSAAVLIGAFMIHGMVPGPSLFHDQGPLIYAVMIGMFVANLFMLLEGRFLSRVFALITKVPDTVLAPILLMLCAAGAYSANNAVFDIGVFLICGFISFVIGKLGFPVMPISLGYVLGSLAEFNLRRALVLSEGSWSIFVTRPISCFFLVITVVSVILTQKKCMDLLKGLLSKMGVGK
ncbi:C4-dicarboxylate ABC transporter permease [Clostridium sp. MCC353]|uniref:tripartite tricarboxylate transporter permease n=1 Tax=Clostridium sp. MCC353 TaxID=2592646 RepID=UPI001C01960E|nr:tripartite tricarboxylate transporter permease [Clostridium sp. MCC353]MBT9776735.1 C4-dicarboxylate ABC transporter permease [Clostridium sp. MCC353]